MKLIYQNFDGLDFSLCGAFPNDALEVLHIAKEQSQKMHGQSVLTSIGSEHMPVSVYPSGASGGYFVKFNTGPDGAIWFVKDTTTPKAGNIRISCSSLMLALNGLENSKAILLEQIRNIGATGVFEDEGCLPLGLPPKVKAGRFDYCFDIMTDEDFEPNPKYFIKHPKSRIKGVVDDKINFDVELPYFQSVTIGKMPNRQVIIYDKTAEIVDHHKLYWWDIWGLRPENIKGRIWRIEVRAGGNELDRWNLRTFEDMERMAGDVVLDILKKIRLAVPTDDSNRSRWPSHPIWSVCQQSAESVLAPYTSKADRKKIITDLRENVKTRAVKNIRGSFATLTHLLGYEEGEVDKTIEYIADDVFTFAEQNPKEFKKRVKRAKDKYVFLDDEDEGIE
ncbi:MAG: hypothetical protein PHD48_10970 [Alphaproteobacteria bacterium]|nr:hypothetical protein [Alphaproteobacteria bacterium]